MKNIFFLFLSIFICSCQSPQENPLVEKYNVQFEAKKRQIIANKTDISRLIQQLPPNYQSAIQKGIDSIEKYDLAEFLQKEKMNEEGLLQLFQSVEEFLENIETTKSFTATAEQTEMYNLFKSRLIENKKLILSFISSGEKSRNPEQLSSALFLKKVMQYEIHDFVQNTFIRKDEFEKTFTEVNENWDEFISTLTILSTASELPQ